MVRIMATDASLTGPINIGNPGEYSMLQLAETVLRLTQSRSKLIFKPLPSDDPKQRRPDISIAKSKLGWEPKVSLEDGLAPTIAYFRQLILG
jgi:UDP-glucuronate decarboxylase